MRQYLCQDRQEAAKLAAELTTAAPATPASTRKQTRSCTEGTEHTSSVLKLLDLAMLPEWHEEVVASRQKGSSERKALALDIRT